MVKQLVTTIVFFYAVFCFPITLADSLDKALAAYAEHDIETAITILTDLASNEEKQALMHLAKIQMRAGSPNEALKITKRLVLNYPDDADAHHAYGIANLTMMSEVGVFKLVSITKQARASWDQAVKLDPNHLDGLYALFSYYANAPRIGGGDIEKAAELQARMADLDEGYGKLALGVLHLKAENFAEAEVAFIETTKIMDTAGAYFALAQFYLGQERYPEALEAISNFSTKPADFWDPHTSVEHLVVARAQAGLGNIEAAKKAVAAGLATKPGKRMSEFFKETLREL